MTFESEMGVGTNTVTSTWRTPAWYRIFFPASAIVWFDGGSDLPYTALAVALGVVLVVGPFRPVVRLHGDVVYARGLVFDRRIPVYDITGVAGSYDGLVISTRDGRSFTATGVAEKTNIAQLLGRRGPSDTVADTILGARESALAVQSSKLPGNASISRADAPLSMTRLEKVAEVFWGIVFLVGMYLRLIADQDGALPRNPHAPRLRRPLRHSRLVEPAQCRTRNGRSLTMALRYPCRSAAGGHVTCG